MKALSALCSSASLLLRPHSLSRQTASEQRRRPGYANAAPCSAAAWPAGPTRSAPAQTPAMRRSPGAPAGALRSTVRRRRKPASHRTTARPPAGWPRPFRMRASPDAATQSAVSPCRLSPRCAARPQSAAPPGEPCATAFGPVLQNQVRPCGSSPAQRGAKGQNGWFPGVRPCAPLPLPVSPLFPPVLRYHAALRARPRRPRPYVLSLLLPDCPALLRSSAPTPPLSSAPPSPFPHSSIPPFSSAPPRLRSHAACGRGNLAPTFRLSFSLTPLRLLRSSAPTLPLSSAPPLPVSPLSHSRTPPACLPRHLHRLFNQPSVEQPRRPVGGERRCGQPRRAVVVWGPARHPAAHGPRARPRAGPA